MLQFACNLNQTKRGNIMSFLTDIKNSITNAATNVYQTVTSAVKDTAQNIITSSTASIGEGLARSAIDTTLKVVEEKSQAYVASLGKELATKTTATAQSTIESGIDAIDTTLGAVGDGFNKVMGTFGKKLKQMNKDEKVSGADFSVASALGVKLANILHKKLEDLGTACFTAKTVSLDAFKQQSLDAIELAKPALEEELGSAFVNFLLSPVLNFLKSIVMNLFSSLFNTSPKKPMLTAAPSTKQPEPVVVEAEPVSPVNVM